MINKQSKVHVIIVTYNAEQWLSKCFTSLRESDFPCEIIVIDNGSKDDTVEIIQKKFPEVDLYISKKNLGFGQGNNLGIKKAIEANTDFIFLLNQDAWVENNTITLLIEASKNNQEYGVISPVHLNGEYSDLDTNFRKYIKRDLSKEVVAQISNKKHQNLKEVYPVNFVNAAAWFIPIHCLCKVGGFDPIFFHYGEDFNYLSRVKYFKFKIGVCPKSTICHDRLIVEKDKDILRLNNSSLAYISNINKNLYLTYVREILFLMVAIVYNFVRLRPKRSKAFFSFIYQILSSFKEVRLSRDRNKIEGLSYL